MSREDEIVEYVDEVCGLYFRSVLLPIAGMRIPQHIHDHDHATLVASGAARLFVDDAYAGEFYAGTPVPIQAGMAHAFESLEANTRLICIHNTASADSIKRKAG